jgi:hypothetical protein
MQNVRLARAVVAAITFIAAAVMLQKEQYREALTLRGR